MEFMEFANISISKDPPQECTCDLSTNGKTGE
jgi:hypothetical protein